MNCAKKWIAGWMMVGLIPGAALATCGGGGGGGGGGMMSGSQYQVRWVSWEQARRMDKPVLVYRQSRPSEYSTLCCTKTAEELSKVYPFVKIEYTRSDDELSPASRKVVEELELDGRSLFVLYDPHGNEIDKVRSSINERGLQKVLEKGEKEIEELREDLQKDLEKAVKYEERDRIRDAVRYYGKVLEYKGHPEVKEAEKRMKGIMDEARKRISELKRSEDRYDARSELSGMKSDFRGTELEEEIETAIDELRR